MKLLTYAKNFLELRLRAFIYALFALNGFILGMIVHDGMARVSIALLTQSANAAILREFGE